MRLLRTLTTVLVGILLTVGVSSVANAQSSAVVHPDDTYWHGSVQTLVNSNGTVLARLLVWWDYSDGYWHGEIYNAVPGAKVELQESPTDFGSYNYQDAWVKSGSSYANTVDVQWQHGPGYDTWFVRACGWTAGQTSGRNCTHPAFVNWYQNSGPYEDQTT